MGTLVLLGLIGVWLLKKKSSPQPVIGNTSGIPVPSGVSLSSSTPEFQTPELQRRFFSDPDLPANNNPALVASAPIYVSDPLRFISRTLETQPALTGGRARIVYSGGGGPENKGATPVTERGDVIRQPSWMASEDDYFGAATPSRVPVTAGGGHGQRADDHRRLGDSYGARQ